MKNPQRSRKIENGDKVSLHILYVHVCYKYNLRSVQCKSIFLRFNSYLKHYSFRFVTVASSNPACEKGSSFALEKSHGASTAEDDYITPVDGRVNKPYKSLVKKQPGRDNENSYLKVVLSVNRVLNPVQVSNVIATIIIKTATTITISTTIMITINASWMASSLTV